MPIRGVQQVDEIELNATELRVGCCVIMNDLEQPCAKLIAVVVAINGDDVKCRYLRDADVLKPFRKGCVNHVRTITPVGTFGVCVKALGNEYWCEVVEESSATYQDGKPRRWQDYQGTVKRRADPRVMELAATTI